MKLVKKPTAARRQRRKLSAEFKAKVALAALHLEHPFMGARMLRRELAIEGIEVGRPHIGTLMRRMNIRSLAPPVRHKQALPWAHHLPVPATPHRNRTRQSSLGTRHHPRLRGGRPSHPEGQRLRLSHCRD